MSSMKKKKVCPFAHINNKLRVPGYASLSH